MLALFRQLLTLPIPVVARVDGATRAGGLGLLGACDIVLASARSTFAFSEVRLGLAPAVISLPLRPLLSARAASRYFLTGETFDAATAVQIGLVTATGDDAGPVLDALRRAERQGLRETRPLTTRDRLRALDDEGAAMTELSARLFASPVAQAHFSAFLDRTHRKGS
jgi:enoyl-CoA hydratase